MPSRQATCSLCSTAPPAHWLRLGRARTSALPACPEWGSPGDDVYVTASGGDIANGGDQFHYVSQTWTGDGTLTARVNAAATDVLTKAGLMFRESLDSNASNAFVAILPGYNHSIFQSRSSAGGSTASSTVGYIAAPYWLKLQRTGNVFTPYQSADGITWTQTAAPVTLSLPTTCYVGFAATAHNNALITGAQFDDISLSNQGPPAPAGLSATAGNAQIVLNWTWNPASGATSYTVQRSAASGGPYSTLATAISGASYMDTGLANGATWYYTVAAQGPSGTGTASAPVSATTYTAKEIWRLANFGTFADSGNAADSADPDGDGMTNVQEFMAGTDPNNAASNAPVVSFNTVGTLNGNNKTILEATGNSLDYPTFASNIATAFANNTGGVWNFDEASFNVLSGQIITLNYGASLTNSLVLALTEGTGGTGINQTTGTTGEPTSGNFELGLGVNAATRTFTPDKPLLTVGIFNTDRGDASRIPVLTVTFQDNTTASTSGANADNVYFHGLSGTPSNPIVSFAISQNNFVRYDDLAFIVVSLPAPTNLTAASGSGQTTLSWSAVSGATGYTVQRSARQRRTLLISGHRDIRSELRGHRPGQWRDLVLYRRGGRGRRVGDRDNLRSRFGNHLHRPGKLAAREFWHHCQLGQRVRLRRPRRRRHDQCAGIRGWDESKRSRQRTQDQQRNQVRQRHDHQFPNFFWENLPPGTLRHLAKRLMDASAGLHCGHRRHPFGHRRRRSGPTQEILSTCGHSMT